jgi:uncharacterized protein
MGLPSPDPASTCIVTGASSGIGAEIARELARRGYGVTLAARRRERLESLAAELRERHGVRADPVVCDVTDPAAREALVAAVDRLGLRPVLLVSNAGFGSEGRFQGLDRKHEVAIVRVHAEAVVDLCALVLPGMVERREGAILTVASTAAFQPMPRMATYAAAKAFGLSFTQALCEDLHGTGVGATVLCPGPVTTEFFKASEVHGGVARTPAWAMSSAEEVARAGVAGVLAGRRTVIPGRLQAAGAVGGRLTPRRILLPLMRRLWPAPK